MFSFLSCLLGSEDQSLSLLNLPVSTIDLTPSLCDLASVDIDEVAPWLEGESLVPSLSIHYQAVEAERTLSINAYTISDDYTLEELMEHWQTLVDKYRDIPMQVFTGASVD
ncbi:MAG: hypothetical protein AB8B63_01475 [Granulosicoccus sp.]